MPWAEWICCLAVSLQMDELGQYERYALAGGDTKKWRWRFRPPDTITGDDIAETIISQWGASNQRVTKGSLKEAEQRGYVKRAFETKDGRYLDESGREIEAPPGYFFVPRTHE